MLTIGAVNKEKAKERFTDNYFNNILKHFDVLPKFPFTIIETMCDYYLSTSHILVAWQVPKRPKTWDIRKLGNITKVPKNYRMIA